MYFSLLVTLEGLFGINDRVSCFHLWVFNGRVSWVIKQINIWIWYYNKKHNFSLCNYFYLVLCFYFDITLCVKLVLYMGSIWCGIFYVFSNPLWFLMNSWMLRNGSMVPSVNVAIWLYPRYASLSRYCLSGEYVIVRMVLPDDNFKLWVSL